MGLLRKRTLGNLHHTAAEIYGDHEALAFVEQSINSSTLKAETDPFATSLPATVMNPV